MLVVVKHVKTVVTLTAFFKAQFMDKKRAFCASPHCCNAIVMI